MKVLLALCTLLFTFQTQAKTVVISDVDDTIKLAFSFGVARGFAYMSDQESRFTGMNLLYQLIQRDQSDTKFYYLSVAPEKWMKQTHLGFLKNAEFPLGTYIGRSDLAYEVHKLTKIQEILDKEQPTRVLLLGDDGQIDAEVYQKTAANPRNAGIQFDQFIHVVSSKPDEAGKNKITNPQVGFVTAVELAVELRGRGYIEEQSLTLINNQVLPRILSEGSLSRAKGMSQAFPFFINCVNIQWKWNIPGLNERIKEVCR